GGRVVDGTDWDDEIDRSYRLGGRRAEAGVLHQRPVLGRAHHGRGAGDAGHALEIPCEPHQRDGVVIGAPPDEVEGGHRAAQRAAVTASRVARTLSSENGLSSTASGARPSRPFFTAASQPVMKTTGGPGPLAPPRPKTSQPDESGITTSVKTTSTGAAAIAASTPVPLARVTTSWPSDRKTLPSRNRMGSASSTTRILTWGA